MWKIKKTVGRASVFVLLILSGCGTWHHATKTNADYASDHFACEKEMMMIYPVAVAGRDIFRPNTACREKNCTNRVRMYQSYDMNEARRNSAVSSCLIEKGWFYE